MMWRLYARDLPNLPTAHPRSAGIMLAARGVVLAVTTILVPTILALITWALLIWALMAIITPMRSHGSQPAALHARIPDLVELPAGTFLYRAAGEFSRGGKPVTAPMVTAAITRPLAVMRHQVSAADYQGCVEAGACPVVEQGTAASDFPMVKVSWRDAQAYASWLSHETGKRFRLPTDEEWAYAAASRFQDDALPDTLDVSDPGQRALGAYDRDANRERVDAVPRPIGSFGANEHGLLDMAGNVWEWTDTCFARNTLDARGDVRATTVNCGVRVVEGRHRTYMSDFVGDARAGGCSIGMPPSNLGFRLVRDDPQILLLAWVRRLVGLRT